MSEVTELCRGVTVQSGLFKSGTTRPANLLSIDVEDWFHIADINSSPGAPFWGSLHSSVEKNFRRMLDILSEAKVSATCFFLGWVGKRFPHLVREANHRGHEVASHGFSHELVYRQTPREFLSDVTRSKKLLEDIVGEPVLGYRAPGFSVIRETLWVFDKLAEAGYKYDTSIFPAQREHGGLTGGPIGPYRIETTAGPLVEFPVSVVTLLGRPLFFFGGGYLRLSPYWIIRVMAQRVNKEGRPVVFYFHPREIEPEHPRLPMGFRRRFKSYINIKSTGPKMKSLITDMRVTTFRDWLQEAAESGRSHAREENS